MGTNVVLGRGAMHGIGGVAKPIVMSTTLQKCICLDAQFDASGLCSRGIAIASIDG